MPSVIALDAMGSDRAPKPEIEGAILAARQYGVRVLLVGPENVVKAELDRHPAAARLPIEIVHASEVITMEDKVEAIRAKRDSSMRVGLRMVREGQAARFRHRRQHGRCHGHGESRAGRGSGRGSSGAGRGLSDGTGNPAMLLDVGANVDCTAAESRTVRGDGRHLLSRHVRQAAGSAAARRLAFDRRRRKQGQRTHARSLSSCSSSFR